MKKALLLSFILGVFFTSCQNNNPHEDYTVSQTGLFYKFYENNQGENPQLLDILDVEMSCVINDSAVIMPSSRMVLRLVEPLFAGDIFEAIGMMHKDDSASFIVRTDSTLFYLFPELQMQFSADDVMRFEVKLNDFFPESELESKQMEMMKNEIEKMKNMYSEQTKKSEIEIQKYLTDNNLSAEPTSSGLYYIKTKDGNGEKVKKGSIVSVHYTGTLLNGNVFDSSIERNEPIQFKLGVGQVIMGWDEGIQMMSKGEKGVLIIPYYLAYGDRAAGEIPPFSTLIFEVELIDFN